MKLLTVIPSCKNDAARAEQLIDMIFHLNNRQPQGHCLLVFAPSVHDEMKAKLKLSASLAFESVEEHTVAEIITMTTHEQCMEMLNSAAQYIYSNFTWPWLWLEPDCLPLKRGWMTQLHDTYHNQPRKYMGLRMTSSGVTFLMRCCIYPYDAFVQFAQAREMNITLYEYIVNRSPNCRLFQWLAVNSESDSQNVREDAVLLHHDKKGVLVDWVLSRIPEGLTVKSTVTHEMSAPPDLQIPVSVPKRGRPAKAKFAEPVLEPIT